MDAPLHADTDALRYLAFYLPQFHPFPENDVWWGRGFTEWTNVVQARPLFEGHAQPRIPADLGFYDLRLPETRIAQAELARSSGIDGFVYYHYWFNGRRLLQRPFEEVMASGAPDFPFALCWANESWSRTWSGRGSSYLVAQSYSHDDDVAHISGLLAAFADPRYIRVGGRPLLVIYNLPALPDPLRTIETWAAECERAGELRPYLVKCDTFLQEADPRPLGADASCDFPPHGAADLAPATHIDEPMGFDTIDYDTLADAVVRRPAVPWIRHPTVVPAWDNTARRTDGGALVLRDPSPETYERWLAATSRRAVAETDEAIVFINAWNEWAEGAHLEPDQRWGRAFLDATLRAKRAVVEGFEPAPSPAASSTEPGNLARVHEALLERNRVLEADGAEKFEAGQDAARAALDEREADLAATRAELRRVRAWAETLQAEVADQWINLAAAQRAAELEAENEVLRVDQAALAARIDELAVSPYWRLRRRLGRSPWARRVALRLRGLRGPG